MEGVHKISMNLKCKINEIEYEIEQSATFIENFNETLDSGVINLTHVSKIKNLKPYHDVFIYDSNYEFIGYHLKGQTKTENGDTYTDNELIFKDNNSRETIIFKNEKPNFFFKHLLVNNFQETQLRIGSPIYNYQIDLFSETKKLEKVIVPNISITRNFKEPKSCWFYLEQYIRLFSPKFKMVINEETSEWIYEQKYRLDESLKEVFDGTSCPEMSWSNPSLRDVLSQIMIVKDRIPYVENDIIKALDISSTTGVFDVNNSSCGFVYSSMTSENYATDGRREYGNAISNENSARLVEYLGFRTPNSAVLSVSDMVLETRYPIYKINKLYMCYYKRFFVGGQEKAFLCRQNITPLVLQNTVRNTLPTDWKDWNENPPATVEEMAKHKLATIGYDIGSNQISGWGTTYTYPTILWFDETKSYIENLINQIGKLYPTGAFNYLTYTNGQPFSSSAVLDEVSQILPETKDGNITDKLKQVFFEMDYIAMYNGAIVHSKDNIEEDDIVTADNCNAALTVLEIDGSFEKEKMNRLGNKDLVFPTRYEGSDGYYKMEGYNHILGAYIPELDNAIVYKREYSIFDTEVKASFNACYDYVMKNYFTSVWAKYRTYSLMPYNESIVRAENARQLLLLSKENNYYEKSEINFDLTKMLSAFNPTDILNSTNYFNFSDKINTAKFVIDDKQYLSDLNAFCSGKSLCFNVRMYDNVSAGNYIDELHNENVNENITNPGTRSNYLTTQLWYDMTNNRENAFVENMKVVFSHTNLNEIFYIVNNIGFSTLDKLINYSFKLPVPVYTENEEYEETNKIEKNFNICKDNKEVIDATFQFDVISNDKDIFVTSYFNKLNDLIATEEFKKIQEQKDVYSISPSDSSGYPFTCFVWNHRYGFSNMGIGMVIRVEKSLVDNNIFSNIDDIFLEGFTSPRAQQGYTIRDTGALKQTLFVSKFNYFNENEIGLTIRCRSDLAEGILFKFIDTAGDVYESEVIPFNYTNPYFSQEKDIVLTRVESEIGDEYYYYKYVGDNNFTKYQWKTTTHEEYYSGPVLTTFFQIFRSKAVTGTYFFVMGDKDPRKLNTNNSDVRNGFFIDIDQWQKSISQNMFIAYSTEPLREYLVQEDALYDGTGRINDTTHILIDKKVSDLFEVFYPNKILVKAYNFKDLGLLFGIKSLQYWWKDDNDRLHLVFGVNIDKFEDFTIYISSIKQRSKKVYSQEHVYINDVTDYNENVPYSYGFSQHYGNGTTYPKDGITYENVDNAEDFGTVENCNGYYIISIIE